MLGRRMITFGARSTEATLKCDASIEVRTNIALNVAMLSGPTPKAESIREKVDY